MLINLLDNSKLVQVELFGHLFDVFLCVCSASYLDGGGAACAPGLSGSSDGAGDRGDPPALPGQEAAHPGRH